jgi:hypothetical protein
MKRKIILSVLVWTMTILLAGCGGGGGGSSDSSTVATTTPASGGSTPVNSKPIANAGIGQTVAIGETVSLDGTGSADPDGDLLTFQWTILSQPANSTAGLLNPDTPNPLFTPDKQGDYVFQLVVTDSHGLASDPATVTISTINSAPVADAGPDQSVASVGTTITLGGQSFDPDGDDITYLWSIKTKPSGSAAALSDPTSPTPTFVVDVHGDYVIELVVSDSSLSSLPDTMIVSFDNLKPVAVAGDSFAMVLGNSAPLDGSESSDPNHDPLTYKWSFVYKPENSQAQLINPLTAYPTFLPDLAGTYVVSLIVNDGQLDSDPSTISITVVSSTNPVINSLITAINGINPLDSSAFKNLNLKKVLTNKINTALDYIDQGLDSSAKNVLGGIIKKMDGCAKNGNPDKNDWIITCDAQDQAYPYILDAINGL